MLSKSASMTFAPLDFLPRERGLALSSIEAKHVIQLLPSNTWAASQMCFGAFSVQPWVRENLIDSSWELSSNSSNDI